MLTFLKLGGSLITDKTRPYTARVEKIQLLVREMADAIKKQPDLQLILGHGSGSFGHQAASQYNTRSGVKSRNEWQGFAKVWHQATALNRLVLEALHHAGIPAVTVSPFSSVTAHDGRVSEWNLFHLNKALTHGLIPVVHGDVFFDEVRGGTILSTEELFLHLGMELKPGRILLAGLEEGIWQDYPARKNLIRDLSPNDFFQYQNSVGEGLGIDVTGGMQSKVETMLSLVQTIPGLEVVVFSGEIMGNLEKALWGENPGTRIYLPGVPTDS